MFALAIHSNLSAKNQTSAVALADQKLEQLRSLPWAFNTASTPGFPVSDTTTDLSADPPRPGGRRLQPSPVATLEHDTPGYVDYLDANGRWVGKGPSPPPGAYYLRRWSIEPLPVDPSNTLILQVLVTTLRRERVREAGSDRSTPRRRFPDDAWLVSVKTRKAR